MLLSRRFASAVGLRPIRALGSNRPVVNLGPDLPRALTTAQRVLSSDNSKFNDKLVSNSHRERLGGVPNTSSRRARSSSLEPQPEDIVPWVTGKLPPGFWKEPKNHRLFLDWLGKRLGFSSLSDWYRVSREDFRGNFGATLFSLFGDSRFAILSSVYPEHVFVPTEFEPRPRSYWHSEENQKEWLKAISPKLGIKEGDLTGWYKVKRASLRRLGGIGLLKRHNDSIPEMLRKLYPDHKWEPSLFLRFSGDGNSAEEIDAALSLLERTLHLSSPRDWYAVSKNDLTQLGLTSLLWPISRLVTALKEHRPGADWKESEFNGVRTVGPNFLRFCIRQLWPNEPLLENYEPFPGVTVTYYLPSLKLAFEYQTVSSYGLRSDIGKVEVTLKEDSAKQSLFEQRLLGGMIFVPFWWDRTLSSLLSTIYQHDRALFHSIENSGMSEEEIANLETIPRTTKVQPSTWRKFLNQNHS